MLYVFSLSLSDFAQHRAPFALPVAMSIAVMTEVGRSLTSTSLWFVPNLFVSLGTLLLFRKHLNRLRFGAALLAVNLFYVANIYMQWIPPEHNRALFAFIFYLWLGSYAATHLAAVNRLLAWISTPVLLVVTILSAGLSFTEARLLLHLYALDPLNTLRLSNQIFSVLVVLCFCKLPRAAWPRFVDVPRHTFGIYLSHAIIVAAVLTLTRRLLEHPSFSWIGHRVFPCTLLWVIVTAVAWTAGFLLSRAIAANPALCWLQGVPPLRYKALPESRPAPLAVT
jgi:surface polysaccharide O-acyltransferase-like enzyme